MNERFKKLLEKAGINVKEVTVLGRYVHIDSYKKYDTELKHALSAAGFRIIKADSGPHLDSYKGYRISAKLM